MDYGRVLGGMGGGAIAVLPATGGNRSVVFYVALASIVLGAAVLLSAGVRFVAKRR